MIHKNITLNKIYYIFFSLGILIFSPTSFSQGYGPNGKILKNGETPAPNAICQSYGYGNILQTKCFDSDSNQKSNNSANNPQLASKIDLTDTVENATSGEHRTVYTYTDREGITHYTETVPDEYKKTAQLFKNSTHKETTPHKIISYPTEDAGPAIAPENPSIGTKYTETVLPADKGISSTGTKISSKNRHKTHNKSALKNTHKNIVNSNKIKKSKK